MMSLVAARILVVMIGIDASGGVDTGPVLPRGRRPRTKIAALIVICAMVAGVAFAVTEAVSGPGAPAAAAPGTASALSGPAGQAAVLNGALAAATSAYSTAPGTPGHPRAAARRAGLRRLRRALVRLRRLGGMYGQFSFETRKGPRTLAFERGTLSSVTGGDVSVRAADGTTWTWVLTGASVVRRSGARTQATALAAGQRVFAAGSVISGKRDARLIVIRPPGTAGT